VLFHQKQDGMLSSYRTKIKKVWFVKVASGTMLKWLDFNSRSWLTVSSQYFRYTIWSYPRNLSL